MIGTPTYVIAEADFRHRIRSYRAAVPDVRVVYAGQALLTTATAIIAGVNPNQIVLHGRATTVGELRTAARSGVGWNPIITVSA
jgi:diaminopimelate decarboxylase